jgi:hypothetical protein
MPQKHATMSLLSIHTYWKHVSGPPNLAERIAREKIPFLVVS